MATETKYHDVVVRRRVPRRRDLPSAYHELQIRLQIEFSDPKKNRRDRIMTAIVLLGKFLAETGCDLKHVQELFELVSALKDLERGSVAPLLQPAQIWNRAPESSHIWRRRAHVAAGVKALTADGLTLNQAGDEAARTVKTIDELMGKPQITKAILEKTTRTKTILSWTKEFSKGERGSIKDVIALKVFGRLCVSLQQRPLDRRALAKQYFRLADLSLGSGE
jgi:hypothetical protein